MVIHRSTTLAAMVLLLAAGCQQENRGPPPDYASFYQAGSRQWVTKVDGIKPEAAGQIRAAVEGVSGVKKGSVLVHADYVAFQTEAALSDRMEHSRIGSDVSAVLKELEGLDVGDSTTGPQ